MAAQLLQYFDRKVASKVSRSVAVPRSIHGMPTAIVTEVYTAEILYAGKVETNDFNDEGERQTRVGYQLTSYRLANVGAKAGGSDRDLGQNWVEIDGMKGLDDFWTQVFAQVDDAFLSLAWRKMLDSR
jgi:hypothetical protein